MKWKRSKKAVVEAKAKAEADAKAKVEKQKQKQESSSAAEEICVCDTPDEDSMSGSEKDITKSHVNGVDSSRTTTAQFPVPVKITDDVPGESKCPETLRPPATQ